MIDSTRGFTMIRIHLSPSEATRLEQAFRSTDDRKLRDRLQIVRMAHAGRAHHAIAADLGVNRKTVTRWLNAFCDGGLDALRPRKSPGKAGHIPSELADTVRQWVIDGPAACGLDRANWTHEELAAHLLATHGVQTSRSAVQRFCSRIGVRLYRPTSRSLRGDPAKQTQAKWELADLGKERRPANSSCGARTRPFVPMVPTLAATLGVKGHRPTVGTRDDKDLLYVFAVVNMATAGLHSNLLDSPKNAKKATGQSKTRRMQEAFAAHLRHVGRMYPAGTHNRVVLVIDNAPWHRGKPIDEALADNRHLEFYRLPSYSPQLNPVERFWKKFHRRATHNRLFDTLTDRKASVRNSLRYFQTVRQKVKTRLTGRQRKSSGK